MEIGHNVLHGQWDWMRDPKIHSTTWEWDHVPGRAVEACPQRDPPPLHQRARQDNDLGCRIMRVDEAQEWAPRHLLQPALNFVTACIFEYGITLFDLDLGDSLSEKRKLDPEKKAEVRLALAKVRRQVTRTSWSTRRSRAGPGAPRSPRTRPPTCSATCGATRSSCAAHFPRVSTFEQEALPEHESRGQWYLRQMLGSANISGPRLVHPDDGNLSHQIEHHVFPDLPSNRYAEIAPRVRAVFERFELPYNSRPWCVRSPAPWHKVIRLSLPNGWLAETNRRNLVPQLRHAVRA